MTKTLFVIAVLLIGAYVIIQGSYVFKETPMSGNAAFTYWNYERQVNWPLGDTLIAHVRPVSEDWKEGFPAYDRITIDRFFYQTTKKVYLNQ